MVSMGLSSCGHVNPILGGDKKGQFPFEKDDIFVGSTLPKTNIAPENGWLED